MGQGREKTRIAIFTLTRDKNYGNRLQNYALQEVLKSFADETHDVDVETVDNKFWRGGTFSYNEPMEACVSTPYQKMWQQKGWDLAHYSHWIGREVLRQAAFQRFERQYIQESPIVITPERGQEAAAALRETYDWGVAGSDQLWNPELGTLSIFDFAGCMEEGRRVSYAGSFGLQELPASVHDWFRTQLGGLSSISVREESGARIVKELTGRDAEVVPDPTMLLPPEIWRLVMKRPQHLGLRPPYLLMYDIWPDDRPFIERAKRIAAERGWSFLLLPGGDVPLYDLDPAEFVYLFAHAAAVLTDSFHGTCFSLLFQRPLLALVRKNETWDVSPRFDTLLRAYGVEGRRVTKPEELTSERLFCDDMQDVPRRVRARRAAGAAFLERAMMTAGSGKLRLNSVALMRKDRCTGCTACAAACPQAAITMKNESRGGGFTYPVVDPVRCRDCGQCLAICLVCTPMTPAAAAKRVLRLPSENEERPIAAHLVIAQDDDIRRVSSSGGVFPLLAMQTLASGGVVIGVAVGDADSGWHVHHTAVETAEELPRLLRSKYVQSDKGDIFRQTAAYLRAGRNVLFSGTGCEVRGLLRCLGAIHQDTSRLLAVDIVCHGVPSPLLWEKYMKIRLVLDGQAPEDVLGVRFRDKKGGWFHNAPLIIDYRNGARHASQQDLFQRLFFRDFCLRASCFHCPARSQFTRPADGAQETADTQALWRPGDLTLGDFWGIECTDLAPRNDDKGASLVFAYSQKGRKALHDLAQAGAAVVQDVALPESFLRTHNPNVLYDLACPEERAAVLEAVTEHSGMELLAALEKAAPSIFRPA